MKLPEHFPDLTSKQARAALTLIIALVILGTILLLTDLLWDTMDDEISGAIAAFITGVVTILAYGVARAFVPAEDGDDDPVRPRTKDG